MSTAEAIDELLRRKVTFAAFRIPGGTAKAYIQSGGELLPARRLERCFVLGPFLREPEGPYGIAPDLEVELDAEVTLPPHLPQPIERPSGGPVPGLDRAGYHAAVTKAVERIHDGTLFKVVLARTVPVKPLGSTPGSLFQAAMDAMPHAMVAMAFTERHGLWMGASPERLLMLAGGTLEVDALAGTQPAHAASARAADWGAKERAEQEAVTRVVVDTLKAAGVTELGQEGPHVKHAGPVAHLHTRITGKAGQEQALALAGALHPTPAVGGTPREAAMAFMAAAEPRSRGLYAGYWGPHTPQHTELFVNIRCMELFDQEALLHVGAGITAASDPDKECDEVERKADTWMRIINALRSSG